MTVLRTVGCLAIRAKSCAQAARPISLTWTRTVVKGGLRYQGGRQLDHTVAPLDVLPEVVAEKAAWP